jgi:hypothetical protein
MTPLAALALAAAIQQPVAFVGVNVVPMDTERVLRDQTVVVDSGRIVALGSRSSVRLPRGARRIEARGRYLMPGLADMHAHPELPGDLALYLGYGVTTLAHMGGPLARIVGWRDSVRAGALAGPDILAGFFLPDAATPEAARRAVVNAANGGADFIKVYNALSADEFAAIIDEARARRLPVMGHAVRAVGLERGFSAGQAAVVHAEEYLYSDLHDRVDPALIPGVVEATRRTGAWVVPNLSAYNVIARQWGRPAVIDTLLAAEEVRYLPQYWTNRWRRSRYIGNDGNLDDRVPFLRLLTGALHRAGVPLLLGTDSPGIPGMAAGVSIHEDLALMAGAGLSNFEALAAGTRNAGRFVAQHFRDPEPFGTVAVGQRADLVLLERNPLERLANARQPLGVMARGRWYPREALMAGMESAQRAGRTAAVELERVMRERGADAAIAHYRLLRRDSAAQYRSDEDEMNQLGYDLLNAGDARGALVVMRLNTEDYPRSANAFDSFADAALAVRDSAAAARAYERVLQLVDNEDRDTPLREQLTANARRFLDAWSRRGSR